MSRINAADETKQQLSGENVPGGAGSARKGRGTAGMADPQEAPVPEWRRGVLGGDEFRGELGSGTHRRASESPLGQAAMQS